jgi:peptide/nickel transport system permease protein
VRRFVLVRLIQALLTSVVLSAIVFFGSNLTGDTASYLAHPDATIEDKARLRHILGLDRPLYVQYFDFLKNAVQGDFGTSLVRRQPAGEMLFQRIPATVQLASVGLLLAVAVGIPLGVASAVRRGGVLDKLGRGFAILGMSAPQFWVAIMLLVIFGVYLQVLPTHGRGGIEHYILPGFVISLFPMAGIIRLTRSSMLEVLDSEYIKFAIIKGLNKRTVVYKHALKNAIIPVLTFGGVSVAAMMNGSVVIESVFAWPGIGRLMLTSIHERDMHVMQATILAATFFYIFMSTAIDILYGYVDPRIRYR